MLCLYMEVLWSLLCVQLFQNGGILEGEGVRQLEDVQQGSVGSELGFLEGPFQGAVGCSI